MSIGSLIWPAPRAAVIMTAALFWGDPGCVSKLAKCAPITEHRAWWQRVAHSDPKEIMNSRPWMAAAVTATLFGASALLPASAHAAAPAPLSSASEVTLAKRNVALQAPLAVRVTLGGGKGMAGATVQLKNPDGTVFASKRTNPSGIAMFDRSNLPAAFTAAVSGGTSWEKLGRPQFQTQVKNSGRRTVVFLSPMTAIASMAAKQGNVSMATAMLRTKAAMGVPAWASASQMGMVPQIFDPSAFQAYAAGNGGTQSAMVKLARAANSGERAADFAPMNFTMPTPKSQLRSGASTALWVGETVMKQVVGAGVAYAIGNVFGQQDPDAADFATVETDLTNISTQLASLQSTMNDLLALMSLSLLTETQSQISTIVNATQNQWDAYDAFLKTVDPSAPDYEQTTCGYANDFYNQVASNLSEWNNLFSTSVQKGVLETMYDNANGKNTGTAPPWWNQYNVSSITGFIDYYGTLQAQSQALADESFKFSGTCEDGLVYQHSETSDYISSHDTSATTLNNNIYLSMPTQIDGSTIATPANEMIYRGFNVTINQTQHQYVRNDQHPQCYDTGNTAATQPWPTLETNKSQWPGIWAGKLQSATGGTWTMASSSLFPTFKKSVLDANGNEMWALQALSLNTGGNIALVTSETIPSSGYNHTSSDDQTHIDGWLFCDNTAVDIAAGHSNSTWVTEWYAYISGEVDDVRLLAQQQGSFHYVAPPSS